MTNPDRPYIDVLIICALKSEYDHLVLVKEKIIEDWSEALDDSGFITSRATFEGQHGYDIKIIASHSASMGREDTQSIASVLLGQLSVDCLAMSGFCAGNKKHVNLGDVIFADMLWSYDAGKIEYANSALTHSPDSKIIRVEPQIVQRMQNLALDLSSTCVALHPSGTVTTKVHVAPLATGASVVKIDGIFDSLSSIVRKISGLDMEASALGSLAMHHQIPIIVSKGVADFADGNKNDNWHSFASCAAAEYLISFLRSIPDILARPKLQGSAAIANINLDEDRVNANDYTQLIQLLADQYPTSERARALWSRAGGYGSEVDNIANPRDLWQQMWQNCINGARVTPLMLLKAIKSDLPHNAIVDSYIAAFNSCA